jgi:hypothetical protein
MSLAHKLNYYETQVANIWRSGPESKEQSNIIYKINHQTSFLEDNIIKSSGSFQRFENRFPFFPKISTLYFNIDDIKDTEEISNRCYSFKSEECVNQLRTTM